VPPPGCLHPGYDPHRSRRRSSVISRTRSNSETASLGPGDYSEDGPTPTGGGGGGSGTSTATGCGDGNLLLELPHQLCQKLQLENKSEISLVRDELDFYYGIVKRHILNHQSLTTGLFPANSGETRIGSVRDTIYCCQAMWALYLGYEKIDWVREKGFEMRQSCVSGMQGVLMCWMRQAKDLEEFKTNQSAQFALHVLFDLDDGFPVKSVKEYHHLQLDVVSSYLLFLAQAIKSGLDIICNMVEVQFVQNLVYYVERTYRTPDFGMWERGTVANDGTTEISASSIAMAKAALEAMTGFNLYGSKGASYSSLYVDVDAHNRNRMILDTLLPRQSSSKSTDASLLTAISFPAFGTHKEQVYNETKRQIVDKLSGPGEYGFKRFSRDGYGTVCEGNGQRYYPEGKLKDFDRLESEWPIFYAYMIIDGVFNGKTAQIEKYQKLLKRRLCYTETGDPLMPKYYYVTAENVREERSSPGSTVRCPSSEGSMASNVFLWGQSVLVIADLLTSKLISHLDLDPLCRHLPPHHRSQSGNTTNFETKGNIRAIVQVAVIAQSSQLQAALKTFGVACQTPDEIQPVQIWSQWDLVKVFKELGQNNKLKITGRPSRPIGVLGTSVFYRISGKTVLCYPLTFSASDFYLSHDLALLCAAVRSDLRFLSRRWRRSPDVKRPTYCLMVTENNLYDPQFPEILALLSDIRMQKIDGVHIQLGRVQNLINAAAVETMDYSRGVDLKKMDIEPYKQNYHKFRGFVALSESSHPPPKVEPKRDFVAEFNNVASNDIEAEILTTGHMFGKIQLLGILLKRHGKDYLVENVSVENRLLELNKEAGKLRYWCAVRYSSSLLEQMVDSLSPYVSQILVSGKQVTVGTIGVGLALFDKPMAPGAIHNAIYTKVQPFNVISAVLQQELIRYCGTLISINRDMFNGMIKVRMGWVLRAIEVYHEITSPAKPVEAVENLPPSKVRQLLYDVLSESQVIKRSFEANAKGRRRSKGHDDDNGDGDDDDQPNPKTVEEFMRKKELRNISPEKSTVITSPLCSPNGEVQGQPTKGHLPKRVPLAAIEPLNSGNANGQGSSNRRLTQLSVYEARQINGCLVKTPTLFYEDVWFVLKRCKGGFKIGKKTLSQEPALSNFEGTEEAFAHEVESMLNDFSDPVDKQMVVEFLCVVATILKRHPGLQLNKTLDTQTLIDKAVQLYQEKAAETKDDKGFVKFQREAVSTTSMFFAKAAVHFIMNETNIIDFVEGAAASAYECPIQ